MANNLRNFDIDIAQHEFYKKMYKDQTYNLVLEKKDKFLQCIQSCKNKMTMKAALHKMDSFIDPSDPDLDLPNSIHAYQTAEKIRRDYPDNYEFQLCGLIHDLGKVLYTFGEPSHLIVGDTYVLGCEFPKSIVYYDTLLDVTQDKTSEVSKYKQNCGIENLILSWGHDEYLYLVLKYNKDIHTLSNKYLNMIRFHSFYPWHSNGEYRHFMKDSDNTILTDVQLLNNYDLYSKEDTEFFLTDDIKKYYSDLLDTYFPNTLNW